MALFYKNIQSRDSLADIKRLRYTQHVGLQLQGRTILNNNQAQLIFRITEKVDPTDGSILIHYYCLTVNQEFTMIFGPLLEVKPIVENTAMIGKKMIGI